jgi:hypothetical protein
MDKHSPEGIQSLQTGRILLHPAEFGSDGRTEFDCVFMVPGHVKTVTMEDSNWLIPAEVIERDAPKFNSVACYLDHAGWFDSPEVKNLVGVTYDTEWSPSLNALVGKIRLYDQEEGSPGHFIAHLMSQILADIPPRRIHRLCV